MQYGKYGIEQEYVKGIVLSDEEWMKEIMQELHNKVDIEELYQKFHEEDYSPSEKIHQTHTGRATHTLVLTEFKFGKDSSEYLRALKYFAVALDMRKKQLNAGEAYKELNILKLRQKLGFKR